MSSSRAVAQDRHRHDSGQALVEFLLVIPFLMLFVFGIIEMGAAWRTYQVVTNTAREGARIAVLPSADEGQVRAAVHERLQQGGLHPERATVDIICQGTTGCFGSGRTGSGTEIRIAYPYTFIFLRPIADFIDGGGDSFGTVTMQTGIVMRNE